MSTTATTKTRPGFDVDALRRGIENGDIEALIGLYAEDATLEIVDQTNPPSSPLVFSGRAEIRRLHDEISCRDMVHRLEQAIVGSDGAAYLERCEYPDGPGVVVASTLVLRDGAIVRQVLVQSWDA